jgi:hypothetical protein
MSDYRRTSVKYGKKVTAAKRARKLTRQQISRTVLSLRNYGAWNRGEGNVRIASVQPSGTGFPLTQPVHLWDLTCMTKGTGTGFKHPVGFYELGFTNELETGTVQWKVIDDTGIRNLSDQEKVPYTTSNDAVSGFSPQYQMHLSQTDSSSVLVPSQTGRLGLDGKYSYIESFKAHLMLNGPQQKATKWCIQLVQFSEEVSPYQQTELATAFWQQLAKPYGYNPLEPGLRASLRRHMKILKTVVVNMDAPESSEDHLNARMRQVDFRGFLNRNANYKWDFESDRVNLDRNDVVNDFDQDHNVFSTHVHPKARIYMMVRALCTLDQTAGWSAASQPSYDIKLDVVHRNM